MTVENDEYLPPPLYHQFLCPTEHPLTKVVTFHLPNLGQQKFWHGMKVTMFSVSILKTMNPKIQNVFSATTALMVVDFLKKVIKIHLCLLSSQILYYKAF